MCVGDLCVEMDWCTVCVPEGHRGRVEKYNAGHKKERNGESLRREKASVALKAGGTSENRIEPKTIKRLRRDQVQPTAAAVS